MCESVALKAAPVVSTFFFFSLKKKHSSDSPLPQNCRKLHYDCGILGETKEEILIEQHYFQ